MIRYYIRKYTYIDGCCTLNFRYVHDLSDRLSTDKFLLNYLRKDVLITKLAWNY